MSLLSSQLEAPTSVTIPLEKFSHNTSRVGTRKYTWTHIGPRSDLDLSIRNVRVIDEHGSLGNRMVMKVTAGMDLVESQDLGELVKCLRGFAPTSENAENPIQMVIRAPIYLAMVYPKSAVYLRRIQFKFRNEIDFTKAVGAFSDLGFPTRESFPPGRFGASSVPPQSSSPVSVFSAASAATSFTTSTSIPRAASAAASHSFGQSINIPNSLHFKIPKLPDYSGHECPMPTHKFSYPSIHISGRSSTSANASNSNSPSVASKNNSLEGPERYHSLYLSQMEKESPGRRLSQPSPTDDEYVDADNYYQLSFNEPKVLLVNEDASLGPAVALEGTVGSRFFPQSKKAVDKQLQEGGVAHTGRLSQTADIDSQHAHDLARPVSTSTDLHDVQNLWIPPRRELPFAKSSGLSKPRPSSVGDLPPLPRPTPISPNKKSVKSDNVQFIAPISIPRPVKKRVAQRKPPLSQPMSVTSPILQKTSKQLSKDATAVSAAIVQENTSISNVKTASNSSSAVLSLPPKALAGPKKRTVTTRPASATSKRLKMTDQSTQTELTPDFLPMKEPSSAASNGVLGAPPPDSYLDSLEAFVNKYRTRPAPQELWEAPGYASASVEERDSSLNEFICENLDNPDFIQLCEDTERAWRRIGLGM